MTMSQQINRCLLQPATDHGEQNAAGHSKVADKFVTAEPAQDIRYEDSNVVQQG